MRLPSTEVAEHNIQPTGGFTIKASPKAFMLLSSQLYKNPIRAIVREISTNAIDAHIAAGTPDAVFDVSLPTQLRSVFSVRDYGPGLSSELIGTLFTVYFESTKTESDDFTGALGLGCKSPFGYTNTFSVISYYNGTKSVYSMYTLDSLPQYKLVSEEPSSEPSGIEVIVPVKDTDIGAFMREALSVFPALTVRPRVNGSFAMYESLKVATIASGQISVYHNSVPVIAGRSTKFGVQQGGVIYPLDIQLLRERIRESEAFGTADEEAVIGLHEYLDALKRTMPKGEFVCNVPMGYANFLPNREELSYDEHTIRHLVQFARSACRDFMAEIAAVWDESKPAHQRIADCESHAILGSCLRDRSSVLYKLQYPSMVTAVEEINEQWRAEKKLPKSKSFTLLTTGDKPVTVNIRYASVEIETRRFRDTVHSKPALLIPASLDVEVRSHRYTVNGNPSKFLRVARVYPRGIFNIIDSIDPAHIAAQIEEHIAAHPNQSVTEWRTTSAGRALYMKITQIAEYMMQALAPGSINCTSSAGLAHALMEHVLFNISRGSPAAVTSMVSFLKDAITVPTTNEVFWATQRSNWDVDGRNMIFVDDPKPATTPETALKLVHRKAIADCTGRDYVYIAIVRGHTSAAILPYLQQMAGSIPITVTATWNMDDVRTTMKVVRSPRAPRKGLNDLPVQVWNGRTHGYMLRSAEFGDVCSDAVVIVGKRPVPRSYVIDSKYAVDNPCDAVRLLQNIASISQLSAQISSGQTPSYPSEDTPTILFFTDVTYERAVKLGMNLPLFDDVVSKRLDEIAGDEIAAALVDGEDRAFLSSVSKTINLFDFIKSVCEPHKTDWSPDVERWIADIDSMRRVAQIGALGHEYLSLRRATIDAFTARAAELGKTRPCEGIVKWVQDYPLLEHLEDVTIDKDKLYRHIAAYVTAVQPTATTKD